MNVLKRVKTDNYKINLNPELTAQDSEVMTMLINLNGGKDYDSWVKGFGKEDAIPNIQKLAIFVRTMRLTHQTLDFANFDSAQWELVKKGIIEKPEDLIIPILEYKIDSTPINNAISDKSYETNPVMRNKIEKIESYIGMFKTTEEMVVYRGERSFNILSKANFPDGSNIFNIITQATKELHEDYTRKKYNPLKAKKIENMFNNVSPKIAINQERFLSTAMLKEPTENFAECIQWEIIVPQNTAGAPIESFNLERTAEAEFLIDKESKLFILDVKYDPYKNIWLFKAVVDKQAKAKPN